MFRNNESTKKIDHLSGKGAHNVKNTLLDWFDINANKKAKASLLFEHLNEKLVLRLVFTPNETSITHLRNDAVSLFLFRSPIP